mgnify:CR=1 FL=1
MINSSRKYCWYSSIFSLFLVLALALVSVSTSLSAHDSNQHYVPRWHNYDGLSFEEHARIMHGIDTRGMTKDQIARLRDRDHDMYGGGHPNAMRLNHANRYSVNPAPRVEIDNGVKIDVGNLHVRVVPNKSVKVYRTYPLRPLFPKLFR